MIELLEKLQREKSGRSHLGAWVLLCCQYSEVHDAIVKLIVWEDNILGKASQSRILRVRVSLERYTQLQPLRSVPSMDKASY